MIKATKFHYEFQKQVNRVSSDFNKSISVAARDSYFNHAKDVVFENLFAIAEINTTERNHLRQLEIKRKKITPKIKQDTYCVFKYPDDFYRLLRQSAIMTTEECNEEREILIHTVQSDDLAETLKDPYWKPSFEWEETVGEEGAEGYYVYKTKDMTIDHILIDYMKKPRDIAAPSLTQSGEYIGADGIKVTKDIDFDVDSTYLWRKVVDIAVAFALRDLGQLDDFQGKISEIMFADKAYLK